ncbi:MAG: FixH family protein [Ignavibacteria bacterium]|nr:FixH family protein [Ignavibacteria bacterium]
MKKFDFHWGWRIGIVYTLFALATLGFVAFAMMQSVDLVRPDYYEQSLQYDATQTARSNAARLADGISISYLRGGAVAVQLPRDHAGYAVGSVLLYRPDEPNADVTLKLNLAADGTMIIDALRFKKGVWKVTVSWRAYDKYYEYQSSLYIE